MMVGKRKKVNRTVKVLKNVAGGRPNFNLPDVAAIAHVAVQRGRV